MTIPSGTKLWHYETLSQLGAGGMGEVYLSQDPKLDRKVALKILPADVVANQERMRRFVQEAKAASALNHPTYFIATIYAGLADKDQAFIWLDRAFEVRSFAQAFYMRTDVQMENLHSDPRLNQLLERVGLPR